MFDADAVIAKLRTRWLGRQGGLEVFDCLDSTQAHLRRQVDPTVGRVVVAREQLRGEGSRQRSWSSARDCGLYFSAVLPSVPGLSLVLGFALLGPIRELIALSQARTTRATRVAIKWPNDLLVDGRKVGGILVESSSRWRLSAQPRAIAGIGINLCPQPVEPFAGALQPAAVLASPWQSVAVGFHPAAFLAAVLLSIEAALDLLAEWGWPALRAALESELAWRGQAVAVVDNDAQDLATGVLQGIDADGALVVMTQGGEKRFLSGTLRPLAHTIDA